MSSTTDLLKNTLFSVKNKSSDAILNIPKIPSLVDPIDTSPESYHAEFDNKNSPVPPIIISESETDKGQLITVTLDNVKAYDNNTRTSPNNSYNDIKESIRVRGLDNKPTITKRPGDDQYMIMNGGNTRLQALNDLYQETQGKIEAALKNGDQALVIQLKIESERYFKHKWEFKEYISELDCFSGHVIENEQRGGTLFIDKALSVQKFKQLFSDEHIHIDLNNSREVASEISNHGWPISHTIINIMNFAIDDLYPFIPNLMHCGFSKVKTLELRKIKRSYESYINKLNNDTITINHFGAIWESALANNDSEDLKSYNISNIRCDLDDAIKLRSGIALFTTSSHIENIAQSSEIHNDTSLELQNNNTENLMTNNDGTMQDDSHKESESYISDNREQISENSSMSTETKNSDNLPDERKESTNTDTENIWSIVYNDAIKLTSTYHFDDCLSNSDKYPGFFIDNHDSIIYSETELERIAVWIWLRSLCFDDSESLLSGSVMTTTQAFELTLYLSKARIDNKKLQRSLTRIEKSIITVNKLLST